MYSGLTARGTLVLAILSRTRLSLWNVPNSYCIELGLASDQAPTLRLEWRWKFWE